MFRPSCARPTVVAVLLLAAFLSVPDESSFSDFVGRHLSGRWERKWGVSLQGLVRGFTHVQSKLGIRHARYDYYFFCLTKHSNFWFLGAFGLWLPLPGGELKLPENYDLGATEMLMSLYLMVFLAWGIVPRFMQRHFELSIENAIKRPWCMITSNFSHEGPLHLMSNIQVIGFLGPRLEKAFGVTGFCRLYLFGGIGAQMVSLVGNSLMWQTPWVSKGASGSIYALMACNAALEGSQRQSFAVFGFSFSSMGLLVARLVVDLASLSAGGGTGIDVWSHFGGLMSGMVFSKWLQGDFNVEINGSHLGWKNVF